MAEMNYFSPDRAFSLPLVAQANCKKIHVIGVCGVAMAQLAVQLTKQGYTVSGSDREFYEPMASLLRNSPVSLHQGYQASYISESVDCVVIGNSASRDNPEVQEVARRQLRYTFFPKALYDILIKGRYSIVVAGTHGKSTTAALLASMFTSAGLDPSFFVGAQIPSLPESLHSGAGDYVVLEGDEYDSAFFAKVPKFLFFKPQLLLITSVEYDHADIYPDLDSINQRFSELVLSLGVDDRVICCSDTSNLRSLIEQWRRQARCSILTYGTDGYCDVRILERRPQSHGYQEISISADFLGKRTFSLALSGAHNAANATAALLATESLGLSWEAMTLGVRQFRGVTRRQQVRFSDGNTILVEDFAHHPTAVKETIRGIRELYPDRRVVAIFEPRSNTSRRRVFQNDYIDALAEADEVILKKVEARHNDVGVDLLDTFEITQKLVARGLTAHVFNSTPEIHEYLGKIQGTPRVFLVMSNGSFDNLPQILEDTLVSAVRQ
jgi:UDP-N-acetylmuramate: L-alanyl-gamma-D-glutamyl-meso-diaminopimelate ligase